MIYHSNERLNLELTIKCLLACHTNYKERAIDIMSTTESSYELAKEALRKLDCKTEKDEFIILTLYGLVKRFEEVKDEWKIKYSLKL